MNLLLLEPGDFDPSGRVRISGRRAQHLREVLRVSVDDPVRAARLDARPGTLTVRALPADGGVELSGDLPVEPPAPRPLDTLLLACPRPKVAARCLETATSLGFGQIVLFRSWRVDKAHLHSQLFDSDRLREHLILGLEQSGRTELPRVRVERLFRPFLEDRLDALLPSGVRLVAHPRATIDVAGLPKTSSGSGLTLALGPERGFTDYELEAFEARGFTPVRSSVGEHPLRVETALATMTGELLLRRSLRE